MWKITEKQYSAEDGSTYTSYGVCYGECYVDDITPSHSAIEKFTDALNRYEASPTHIFDLVENFLAEL